MFKFLSGLDKDIQHALLCQLRDLWTHTSTALEGNTLTLGETRFVLEEGLTVSGKPVVDHQQVIGHARAIELIYDLLGKTITEQHVFDLHKAVQNDMVIDIYKPYGAWKLEPNGTYTVDEHGQPVFLEYAPPEAVPTLVEEILHFINHIKFSEVTLNTAPTIYAKIHMGIAHTHPFWDGNGRIARLIANIPLLNAGLPPIVIARTDRKEYIETLARYQLAIGAINQKTGVWPQSERLADFEHFCEKSYGITQQLVRQAHEQQEKRRCS